MRFCPRTVEFGSLLQKGSHGAIAFPFKVISLCVEATLSFAAVFKLYVYVWSIPFLMSVLLYVATVPN